ncbi:Cof-type HAD-IIB family hydrolase [Cytobacillus purgationiresistens]|uniref:Cof subfamily protein (Haloacid dehalogenase superfamily) n=1 Tax=Cytobacillus purgationiresistens TaxID=863449 RepID=A0ABU0AB15_9BACI|nr:Cof-type HAD-IIB family hydrolase [Cytobacillus purgationiresistens]MDQ0268215.1 Cof subfamily protein (haloacid dehalogenase superfamily) [Cytobacillus purgationiresistens]
MVKISETKAIVVDLDGTLLNDAKQVSQRAMNALLQCNNGMKIVIATARSPRSIKRMLPIELLQFGYTIFYNGALTINEITKEVIHKGMDNEIISTIYPYIQSFNNKIYTSFEIEDSVYTDRLLTPLQFQVFGASKGELIPPVLLESDFINDRFLKMLVPNIDNIYTNLIAEFEGMANTVHTDHGDLILMVKGVSKLSALTEILSILRVAPKETMVFGDDYNDLCLFQYCGYPVAMGNAIEELKTIAKRVTLTNNDSGVGAVLDEVLKGAIYDAKH